MMAPSDESIDRNGTIVPDPAETLDFEPVVRPPPKWMGNVKLFLGLALLTVTGGGIVWYFFGDRLSGGGEAGVPVVRAEEGPVKVRPENPGGMNVPDRDKLIYDRMQGMDVKPPVERLLPPPEAPLPPPKVPLSPPKAGMEATAEAGQRQPAASRAAASRAVAKAKKSSPPAPAVPTIEEVLAVKPPPPLPPLLPTGGKKAKPVIEAKPAASSAAAKPAGPVQPKAIFRVQLAAVRTMRRAQQEWSRLRKNHSDLLGKFELSVTKADLGPGKGLFYRLRAGPLASKAAARDLCAKLAKRKVGCLIARAEK
ncbi:MAG: SPOR domain-containing protein [Rhodospirillales bacterium]|jgi:cell division septation protein DedD|nr:SPOR domain-containing protein [Rhodospirillales bacterium]HIJ43042.1 SPOR domain-containing protein [Rhodospirillaceae bacterium]MDP7216243.1 SPOR domain-containing protein [Rhodospirillales bacterium]HIJ44894.1 SPOR domain-containing protein [Rhodospirillaceae bacterium]HIJ92150.1 SPOR domain-containing protein [Rhodospirillaceae bacterium]